CMSTPHLSDSLLALPKLIVFDLDATLWFPELYKLRSLSRSNLNPVANKDVNLYPDVVSLLSGFTEAHPSVMIAIASRTDKGPWARSLIEQFSLPVTPGLTEIYPGPKTAHFASLAKKTSLPFGDMLFFDDARDGRFGNCEAVARMGVAAAYVPKPGGLTREIFDNALEKYGRGERGVKTIESRKHDMLGKVGAGESVLLHINNKVYPDGGEHKVILGEAGVTDVDAAGEIRVGRPGEICAILKVGETTITTEEDRRKPERVRGVVARAEDAGKYQTRILEVEYLKRGVSVKGKGGVWNVEVPEDVLPDGWVI
ncbi:hypothetical protein TrRE_jg8065, partial [Triparma retinervis]